MLRRDVSARGCVGARRGWCFIVSRSCHGSSLGLGVLLIVSCTLFGLGSMLVSGSYGYGRHLDSTEVEKTRLIPPDSRGDPHLGGIGESRMRISLDRLNLAGAVKFTAGLGEWSRGIPLLYFPAVRCECVVAQNEMKSK